MKDMFVKTVVACGAISVFAVGASAVVSSADGLLSSRVGAYLEFQKALEDKAYNAVSQSMSTEQVVTDPALPAKK